MKKKGEVFLCHLQELLENQWQQEISIVRNKEENEGKLGKMNKRVAEERRRKRKRMKKGIKKE